MGVTLVGDWAKAGMITSTMVARFKKASDMATRIEAERLRAHMIKGIRSGAPGGQKFADLSSTTIKVRKFVGRGGSKPLIQSGMLVGSIKVKKYPGGIYFVGISKTADGGRANIAEMNEYGATIAARLTPKALRFLHAVARQYANRDEKGRFIPKSQRGSSNVVKPPSGGGVGIIIIRIPPRPFVQPTADAHAKPSDVKKRFGRNLAALLGGQLGAPVAR